MMHQKFSEDNKLELQAGQLSTWALLLQNHPVLVREQCYAEHTNIVVFFAVSEIYQVFFALCEPDLKLVLLIIFISNVPCIVFTVQYAQVRQTDQRQLHITFVYLQMLTVNLTLVLSITLCQL